MKISEFYAVRCLCCFLFLRLVLLSVLRFFHLISFVHRSSLPSTKVAR